MRSVIFLLVLTFAVAAITDTIYDYQQLHGLFVPAALLLLDLDRFKEVNDTLGHNVGDLL